MTNRETVLVDEMDGLLRVIGQKYQGLFVPEESDLSAHQIYFLKFLQRREMCTPSEIAQEFGITLGAVTGFIDRLYKLELVKRTRSEADRRLVLIELTAQGDAQLDKLEARRAAKYDILITRLGEEGLCEVNAALKKLKAAMDD
ncbi:MAG: MarR family transcriptional regulator [Peptococcaceae bacterium]|nr:MarR family transcriptional regulator [Peptococcaceae bacterium]